MRGAPVGLALLTMTLLACGGSRLASPPDSSGFAGAADAATPLSPVVRLRESRQLILVLSADWQAREATLATFDRVDGEWQATGLSTPVMLGREGTAWGRGLHEPQPGPQKREGDGRAPAGVFELGVAFGYADRLDTTMTYHAMQATHWCVDVPGSPLYNRLVDSDEVGAAAIEGSTEPMRRDLHADGDQRYKAGFVIRHNPDARSGAGSCIFAHLWKAPGQATAGCTAMDEVAMNRLLGWLEPTQRPLFVLLPRAEYLRLRATWHLPLIEAESR